MWQEMLSRREIVLKSTIEKEDKEENKETKKTTTTTEITTTFYVGDAANRPQDHSDADIAFAKNCEVEFFVPEQFFEGGSFRKFLRNDDDGNEREKETKTARETED
jgi:primase-polymerase (primpol)-like protein